MTPEKRLYMAFNVAAGVLAVVTGIGGIAVAGAFTAAAVEEIAAGAVWAGFFAHGLKKDKHAAQKSLPKPQ